MMLMRHFVNNSKKDRLLCAIFLLFCGFSASVGRSIPQEFDLEVAAAEPRPIFIESGPSATAAEALPLVSGEASLDDSNTGPLSDASEKIEKVLKPAISFSYNNQPQFPEIDGEPAESKRQEQVPEIVKEIKENDKESKSPEELLENGETVAESKHHEKKHHEKKDGGDGQFEKGGGKDFNSHHHGEHGEKGEKGYKGHHHHEKGQKGHHDKEGHHKEYDENGGQKKKHHHDDGYHGEYHKSQGGKKGSKFKEEGEHNKGHSTKGSHSIHKKDEYEKKTEFFEEDHEGGESEKHGGFSHTEEYHKGGHHKVGHNKGGHHEEDYGKKGESAKGGHYKEEEGHSKHAGHDNHHKHDEKHGHKKGASNGKKWGFKESSGNGDKGGDGHGHGAHSHQTYAVQAAPPANQAQDHSHQNYVVVQTVAPAQRAHSFQTYAVKEPPRVIYPNLAVQDSKIQKTPKKSNYKISPISSVVLPLESDVVSKKLDPYGQLNSYQKKNVKPKKRKPTPTDDYLAENPFAGDSSFHNGLTEEPPSTTDISMIRLISEELQIKRDEPKQEGPKMIKKRRLKKRKKQQQKDTEPEASARSSKSVSHKCPLGGHKHERVVPDESSHRFVIVAADDAA
ncbi:hypothetical protein ABEB36_003909 [Hypothenemus hampei]|uniref:Uncharacterized protein n=1 Tax=Hypothenemus hampei TaxID=57062 RepID=A0ABD1F1I7_HYPHA